MTRRLLLLVLISCGTLANVSAEEADPPYNLAGFLVPGMRVGVTPQDESENVKLFI